MSRRFGGFESIEDRGPVERRPNEFLGCLGTEGAGVRSRVGVAVSAIGERGQRLRVEGGGAGKLAAGKDGRRIGSYCGRGVSW